MANIRHSAASGIHPAAYVGGSAPDTTDVQDHILWVDTSSGNAPYPIRMWDADSATWLFVQLDATGYPLPGGHRIEVVPA